MCVTYDTIFVFGHENVIKASSQLTGLIYFQWLKCIIKFIFISVWISNFDKIHQYSELFRRRKYKLSADRTRLEFIFHRIRLQWFIIKFMSIIIYSDLLNVNKVHRALDIYNYTAKRLYLLDCFYSERNDECIQLQ